MNNRSFSVELSSAIACNLLLESLEFKIGLRLWERRRLAGTWTSPSHQGKPAGDAGAPRKNGGREGLIPFIASGISASQSHPAAASWRSCAS